MKRPQVVIVGAGFGGLTAAKCLKRCNADVIVLDKQNHHLFQPLLYQVATAGLSPAEIAIPVRQVLRKQRNAEVRMTEVTAIDAQAQTITTTSGLVSYDYLVVATGAVYNYFSHPEWARVAPSLKSIPDALFIRKNTLLAFEAAEMETDPAKREALLTFVLVGGGPTGVELAGALAELAHKALSEDFRKIRPAEAKVILVEAGNRILAQFPEKLSEKAAASLRRLGVEILTGQAVEAIDASGVKVGGRRIHAHNVLWTAGVAATPVGKWLKGITVDRAGRAQVKPDLTCPPFSNVFVIGDAAHVLGADQKPLPGIAPVAMQEGRYVASHIANQIKECPLPGPFVYRDKGNLATVGRAFAIADFGWIKLSGFFAWILWIVVHIFYLIGFKNRVLVLFQWAWSYFTFQRGTRLITPAVDPRESELRPPI